MDKSNTGDTREAVHVTGTEKAASADKSRLGRGLSALIPGGVLGAPRQAEEPTVVPEAPQEVPLSAIVPNTLQPRKEFDAAALDELTQSVLARGVLQPILVRPVSPGRFELVAGERRFRAAGNAGLKTIPAVVWEMSDEESLTVALIENIQREDLNAMEAARGYRQLIDQFGLTQTSLAKQLGKAQPTIANALRLLRLAPEIQESIGSGQITEEHGKALLSIEDESSRLAVWRIVVQRHLSVAETRRLALEATAAVPRNGAPRRGTIARDVHWVALEDRLRTALGMKVGLKPAASGGGTLTIRFTEPEEIEGIIEKLQA